MVGWLKSVLELNARVFSLLEDVQKINERVDQVDDKVRDMGREISELRGMLKAYRFYRADGVRSETDLQLIQAKVDLLAARLEIKTISNDPGNENPPRKIESDDDEVT